MIGFLGAMMLTGFQLGGKLIDDQMGFSLANVFDPTSGEQVSVTSNFVFYAAVVLFVVMGGLNECLFILGKSFEIVPLLSFRMTPGAMTYVLEEATPQMFILGVTFAAPCIIVVTMATVALGLLGKVVPEMNIFSFSFGVRVLLGLIMLKMSMIYMPGIMETVIEGTKAELYATMRYIQQG
jgi:flagellar biosynthetic protein FliR